MTVSHDENNSKTSPVVNITSLIRIIATRGITEIVAKRQCYNQHINQNIPLNNLHPNKLNDTLINDVIASLPPCI